jgi:hypothetical protein
MPVFPCNFTIPASAPNGSKLAGNGFNTTPRLNSGDSIQVIVRWGGSGGPSQLTAHAIVSPAPSVPSQTTPSPFVDGAKFVCYQRWTANQDSSAPTYTFPPLTYGGSQPGSYELTIVIEDKSTTPSTQWSEDPEFDTGS